MDEHTSHELAYKKGYEAGKPKWIPVMEKLPENEQWVLCRMKDGRFRVFQWSYIDWQWNDRLEWYDEHDVTCWMPLPEPPKGE
jgi:hypothetical protein